nr:unnamed protein product [Digitaria exilis]
MRGGLGSAAESSERRGTSSWSWLEEEDEEEREKRDEARESDASESELSRRSGSDADDEAPDPRPPQPAAFRWRRSFSDLAAAEFAALDAGVLAAAGDGEGLAFAAAAALLSPSSSRHRLEQLGALGENTGLIGSAGAGIASACGGGGGGGAVVASGSGVGAAGDGFRSGSSLPSAKSSSAGSMVAEPPRLNSKSMKSLEMAGSGVATAAAIVAAAVGSRSASGLKDTRGLIQPYGTAVGGRLLATAEAMGGAHQSQSTALAAD